MTSPFSPGITPITTEQPGPTRASIASNERMFLPGAYRPQGAALTHDSARDTGSYWSPWRLSENRKWQHHVYAWASELIRARGVRSVLDVGCGPCVKLVTQIAPWCADITGIDQASAIIAAREQGARFPLQEADLEASRIELGRVFDMILFVDVIEHLGDPDPALNLIRRCAHAKTLVVLSTPERARERGRACMASPKPEHVREWTREEFARLLMDRGFTPHMHRLLPKDDANRSAARHAERDFRLRKRELSPWCCQAWVCTVNGAPPLATGL